MRRLGMNKKGIESHMIVIIILALVVLVVLLAFSGVINKWINQIIDKLFGW